jgi:hypothetical protein
MSYAILDLSSKSREARWITSTGNSVLLLRASVRVHSGPALVALLLHPVSLGELGSRFCAYDACARLTAHSRLLTVGLIRFSGRVS